MRGGVKAVRFFNLSSFIIEGDYLVVTNSVRRCLKVSWEISALITDSVEDLKSVPEVSFNHCFRKVNQAVDFMAYSGDFVFIVLVFFF